MIKKYLYRLLILTLVISSAYGLGRLYFRLTGGFSIKNITSDFAYNSEWDVRPLIGTEKEELNRATNQPYYYLGKGCQSYVFLSHDKQYVIKFFKYQRYRLLPWLAYFPPLPAIVKYRDEKLNKKWNKLDGFVKSWKTAFENLKPETGLLYVHLNKTKDLNKQLTIFDKIGKSHLIDLDQMEFCIQKSAEMLCTALLQLKEKNDHDEAQALILRLLNLIVSEYHRGFADNDHALMQNTGVVKGEPIHIDVGQFVKDEKFKDPLVFHQELYTKTFKFKIWLLEEYPQMAIYLESQLRDIIGPQYEMMKPKFRVRGL
ncbi:MAG: hypothetical protein H0W88_10530 [Parachlamydiaceae bacterium]|nr:hypothetical protein [Parachlamydiaceae bacterium]